MTKMLTLRSLLGRHRLEIRLHREHRVRNDLHVVEGQGLSAHQVHARGGVPGLAPLVLLPGVVGGVLGDPLGPAGGRALANDVDGVAALATVAGVADGAAVCPHVEAPWTHCLQSMVGDKCSRQEDRIRLTNLRIINSRYK